MMILGNCLEEMRLIDTESIDLVLTDPPYGMSYQSNSRQEKYAKIAADDNLDWLDMFVDRVYATMRKNSALFSFCSFHHIEAFKTAYAKKFKVKNLLVWEKNNTSMGDLKGDFAPKVELILFMVKGRPLIRGKRDPNIFKFRRTRNELHPTQKPVDMLEYLISKFSNVGDRVLDPFTGSGSTGVAAINLRRRFTGIEVENKYYDVAKNRIKEARNLWK